jgi:metal-dependent amidase/aminoacylase/carboxypeptidase family protein
MLSSEQQEFVTSFINTISDDLYSVSLQLHSSPELSFQEFKAHDLITKYLQDKGWEVVKQAYGIDTAFKATYTIGNKSKPLKSVGFCAEYDALPDLGHACGHNLIAVSSIAAAMATTHFFRHYNINAKVIIYELNI